MKNAIKITILTITIILSATASYFEFKVTSFEDGKFIPFMKDKGLNHLVAEDGFMTSKLGLAVADGVGGADLPSGYFAYGLCYQAILTYYSNQPTKKVSLSSSLPKFWKTLNNGLDSFIAHFSNESTRYNNQNIHKRLPSLKSSYVLSYSTLVTVYLDNQPNKENAMLKYFQKGDSQFIIFRLHTTQQNLYYYAPVFITNDQQHDFNSSPQFSSGASKQHRKNDEAESVGEIEVLETDIVLLATDGLWDNLFISYITYILNLYLKDMYIYHISGETLRDTQKYNHLSLTKVIVAGFMKKLESLWEPFHQHLEGLIKEAMNEQKSDSSQQEDIAEENDIVFVSDEVNNKKKVAPETPMNAIDEQDEFELDEPLSFDNEQVHMEEVELRSRNDLSRGFQTRETIDENDPEGYDFTVLSMTVNNLGVVAQTPLSDCTFEDILNNPVTNELTTDILTSCIHADIAQNLSFGEEVAKNLSNFFNSVTLSKAIAANAKAFFENPASKLTPFYIKACEYNRVEDAFERGKGDDVTVVASMIVSQPKKAKADVEEINRVKSFTDYKRRQILKKLEADITYLREHIPKNAHII